jgi:general secretion pathway protein K
MLRRRSHSPRPPLAPARRQRGAAILLAMLIMVLVATLAAGMVWLQWRGIEVEQAERARAEGEWLLNGSLDWGSLILKSSINQTNTANYKDDDLGQPWATPLAETKLSSFLSADGNHSGDDGPEAYLSGQITDAQSKYNLYNLFTTTASTAGGGTGPGTTPVNKPLTINPLELQRFEELCANVGVSSDVATAIATGLKKSLPLLPVATGASAPAASNDAVLMPGRVADLSWYGVDPAQIQRLEPYIQLLPIPVGGAVPTLVNVNTAPAEVLMMAGRLTRAQAAQVILRRAQSPLTSTADTTLFPTVTATDVPKPIIDVKSSYFEIFGQLRYEQQVLRERSVVNRVNASLVKVIRRERLAPDAQ